MKPDTPNPLKGCIKFGNTSSDESPTPMTVGELKRILADIPDEYYTLIQDTDWKDPSILERRHLKTNSLARQLIIG